MAISAHEFKVYDFVKEVSGFTTIRDIAQKTGVALRTVNQHAKRLTDLGIFERVELFDGYRYRLSSKAAKIPYLQELERIREVFK